MKPPIWFLDIDGVINSIGVPMPDSGVNPNSYEKIDVSMTNGVTWPIVYSRTLVGFINELNRTGLVEVHWLTTWQQEARLAFAPAVGLDRFFAYDEVLDLRTTCWKEAVVRETLASTDRPYLWTDDDLERPIREAMMRDFSRDCLMIRPSFNPGLNDEHLDDIRSFLTHVSHR